VIVPSQRYYDTLFLSAASPPLVARSGTRDSSSTMPLSAPPSAHAGSAAACVLALCEIWVIIAAHSGVVGAWRLVGVCRAARLGAKEWLRKLPSIVVCGGWTPRRGEGALTSEVWRLDLGALRWERLPNLTAERAAHACCAVRGGVVVLGGLVEGGHKSTAGVEILERDSSGAVGNTFEILPPLSCGLIGPSAAIVIDESESDRGQVLLIDTGDEGNTWYEYETSHLSLTVRKVDLATGVCTAQPSLLCPQGHHVYDCTAGRLPDGRVVCAGTTCMFLSDPETYDDVEYYSMAQILEPPPHGSSSEASWQWRALPGMSVKRVQGVGCVLSDGRFAVFGGGDAYGNGINTSSGEALTLDADGARWSPLPPIHEELRGGSTCAAIGGCVIYADGGGLTAIAEVSEEGLGLWRWFPCSRFPGSWIGLTRSALM